MDARTAVFWFERVAILMILEKYAKENPTTLPPEFAILFVSNLLYFMCFLQDFKNEYSQWQETQNKATPAGLSETNNNGVNSNEEGLLKSTDKEDEKLKREKAAKYETEELQRMEAKYDEYKALCDQELKTARDKLEEEYREKLKKKKEKCDEKLKKEKEKYKEDREKWDEERSLLKQKYEELRWT